MFAHFILPPVDAVCVVRSNVNEASCLSTWKRKLAHKCIDAGANIYVGHGDPRLQGIEIYRGCVILYCLGSLFFQTKTEVGFYGREVWESVIVQVHCHKGEDDDENEGHAREERRNGGTGSDQHKAAEWSEEKRERDAGEDADTDDEHEQPLRAASYSIKLVPIVLNEVGDGWDERHEHVVKGNVIAEKQREEDAEVVATLSRPGSPDQLKGPLLSPLMLPRATLPLTSSTLSLQPAAAIPSISLSPLSPPTSASVGYGDVPSFLTVTSPPSFSLANSPARNPSPPLSTVTLPLASPPHAATLASSSNRLYVPPIGLSAATNPSSPSNSASPLFTKPAPSPRNDELTESSSYALHLSTRGLPRRAGRDEAVSILHKLQTMSAEWGTVIEVDELDDGSVVGWVSTSREQELQHPFLRPRRGKGEAKLSNGANSIVTTARQQQQQPGNDTVDALQSPQRGEVPVEVG